MSENLSKGILASRIAIDGALVLALITVGFYVIGISFYQGFLNYWGLDSTLFVKGFHDLVYCGASFSSQLIMQYWGYLTALVFASFAIVIGHILLKKNTWYHNNLVKLMSDNETEDQVERWGEFFKYAIAWVIILSCLFAIISRIFIIQGYKQAEQLHRLYEGENYKQHELSLDNEIIYIIDCANGTCALFRKATSDIIFVPLDKLSGATKSIRALSN